MIDTLPFKPRLVNAVTILCAYFAMFMIVIAASATNPLPTPFMLGMCGVCAAPYLVPALLSEAFGLGFKAWHK